MVVKAKSVITVPIRVPDHFPMKSCHIPVAKDCLEPMGWTSENVAGDFNISRDQMDQFAAISHSRASEAQRSGKFVDEIVSFFTL